MTILEVRGLRKVFNTLVAVSDVGFELSSGRTLAVVGESGSGKSTLARLLLRLIEPDAGSISFRGVDVTQMSAGELRSFRAEARMVFQDPFLSLDPKLTIGSAVEQPLVLHTRLSRSARRAEVLRLLERVGLSRRHAAAYPYELSGGQLQRAGIARAVATKPRLLVCDEPVAALDMSLRAQVIDLLRELQAELDMAQIFISHDLSLVRLIADEVLVMRTGEIVERAATDALFQIPKHPYTRALLAAIPMVNAASAFRRDSLRMHRCG